MRTVATISAQILALLKELRVEKVPEKVPQKFSDGLAAIIFQVNDPSIKAGIEAYILGGQSNATQLSDSINAVDVVSYPGASVKLLQANHRFTQKVINYGLYSMLLFPFEGDRFYSLGKLYDIDEPILIDPGNGFDFTCFEDLIVRF